MIADFKKELRDAYDALLFEAITHNNETVKVFDSIVSARNDYPCIVMGEMVSFKRDEKNCHLHEVTTLFEIHSRSQYGRNEVDQIGAQILPIIYAGEKLMQNFFCIFSNITSDTDYEDQANGTPIIVRQITVTNTIEQKTY